ncbi:hypothetical protein E4U54_007037 [Claviceps lovelessii]|nr:hypothetical protein E4U54_007037 [Claviceps lovelessii]
MNQQFENELVAKDLLISIRSVVLELVRLCSVFQAWTLEYQAIAATVSLRILPRRSGESIHLWSWSWSPGRDHSQMPTQLSSRRRIP